MRVQVAPGILRKGVTGEVVPFFCCWGNDLAGRRSAAIQMVASPDLDVPVFGIDSEDISYEVVSEDSVSHRELLKR